jgi:hypothetical protein
MNVAVASVTTHGKKSIYKTWTWLEPPSVNRKIYIPNFVTRSLQIDLEEKGAA